MTQRVRAIDWDGTAPRWCFERFARAEGHPGVLDDIQGVAFHLFGGHRERELRGQPGEIIAHARGRDLPSDVRRRGLDNSSQAPRTRSRRSVFKLPATLALALAGIEIEAPEIGCAIDAANSERDTYREISYRERAGVGYLRFDFYNGAMSTQQCERLREAYAHARSRSHTRVIVLLGGDDYFSNGIHLNVIEAANDPAAESWRNLVAINDLVRDIVQTESHLVVSALAGDAAAGGVPLALAGDYVVAREDVVLNPYYQHMGGLYGSEYWTYLLPRRVGSRIAAGLTSAPFTPLGAQHAVRIGLLDGVLGATIAGFHDQTRALAEWLACEPGVQQRLELKRCRRGNDERRKPLEAYGRQELARSHECFFGPDLSYHEARRRFVYKSGTPTARAQLARRAA